MKRYFVILTLLAFICSCSSKKNIIYLHDSENHKNFNVEYSEYRLKVDDVLKIEVSSETVEAALAYNHSSYISGINNSKESFILNGYQVSNSGHIFFPSFGKIYVLNKTVEQVRGELYNKIVDENILINPNIDVKHINAHFTILGEVNKPGKYDYIENNLNIFEAIGMANGLTITGERNNLRIIRGTSESKNEIINIDLTSSSLFDNPKKLQIVSGDIIIINPNNTRIKNAGIIGNSGTLISLLSFILSSIIVINSN